MNSFKMARARFHMKRIGFAVIRMATYALVCGVFFKLGMEIGRHEVTKDPAANRLSKSKLQSDIDYGDPAWHDSEQGEKQDGQGGFLPMPNQKPGEMGKPYKPTKLTDDQKKLMKDGWQKNAINQYVSDLISVQRSLPDIRHPRCKEPNKFLPNLPRTSVIICFHNEAWSILLRSVHSVLDRSPPELLKEIILVDDCSTMDHLKSQLEEYMKKYPKVKIVRSPKRVGLIRGRMLGASVAKGRVLTFLDSHIEATPGWLPPLLDRISRKFTTVVCPIIDIIDDETLEYHYETGSPDAVVHSIGIFDWSLTFNWLSMPERQKKIYNDTSEPFDSPTMAGGLFAISKRFFDHLGRYDPEFDIWGGENLELSFKTWMCGGRLEIVPCSHVGHIFRHRSPYKWREGKNVIKKNLVRLAKVWTDEYSKYYYMRINNDLGDYGNITDRVELRNRLKCRSFKWYIKNIFPEVFIPDRGYAHGEIRNLGLGGGTCLDATMDTKSPSSPVGLYPCHNQGGNQFWTYTPNLEIRRDDMCVDYAGDKVMSFPCHGAKGNQEWRYDGNTKTLKHQVYGKCIMMTTNTNITMEPCTDDIKQKWKLQNYSPTLPESSPELPDNGL